MHTQSAEESLGAKEGQSNLENPNSEIHNALLEKYLALQQQLADT